MRYNQLGRTGLYVSEICLGTMTFGPAAGYWSGIAGVAQADANRIVERALAAGVNFVDTADVYSRGGSETILGQALRDLSVKRSDVVLATKVFGDMGRGPNDRGASRGHIMDGIARSLERLGTDHVDLYQVHANDAITPIDETLRALDDLVAQGMVRYIGVSNWTAWKMAKALGRSEALGRARFETVQAYYSIAGRDLEREIVPFLESEGLGLMVWSPLAGGLLSGKYGPGAPEVEGKARRAVSDFPPVDTGRAWPIVAAMREIASAHGASVAQVALAWVVSRPWVMSTIIGARTIEQLDNNLGALGVTLTDDDIARLDGLSALQAEYPAWMFARQGATRVPPPFKPKEG